MIYGKKRMIEDFKVTESLLSLCGIFKREKKKTKIARQFGNKYGRSYLIVLLEENSPKFISLKFLLQVPAIDD